MDFIIPDFKKRQLNNYQKMEFIFKEIEKNGLQDDKAMRLILHSCCAPCSSHVISVLTEYFNITVLYYNPNIEPYDEYLKRKNEEIRFIKEFSEGGNTRHSLDLMDCDYDNDKFHEMVRGMEMLPEGGERCFLCYEERLRKAALVARDNGYDFFTTTLSVSPYKNAEKINEIGERLEKEIGVKFLYSDFKKKNGYLNSIKLSKEYNLYRQDYCGCIYSKRDSKCKECKKNSEKFDDCSTIK
ncbi:MAG: epoxyqueuosine reductase QueH [Lachnospiraceae bacterium]|nr:epoxyqueuosine reductase QueH [Lachnospiraceae bacterium]